MTSTGNTAMGSAPASAARSFFSRRWFRASATLAVVAAVAGTVYVAQRPDHVSWPVPRADASVPGTVVSIGDSCGAGWTGGKAGRASFALWNSSGGSMEVYLRDAANHKVYLDVENLGAGVTRNASTTLAAGRYRFYCLPDDGSPIPGAVETVTGTTAAAATPGLLPISSADLIPARQAYSRWIQSRLPVLGHQVASLADDLRSGDRRAAKADWLAGHRTYETLGAAYKAFGKYDGAINGDTKGFHKIEGLLWGDAPTSRIAGPATALVGAVRKLTKAFPAMAEQSSTQEIGLRAHEILENAVQFELTGSTDHGSHTNLATIEANLTGTRQALKPLRPLLAQRDADLASTDQWLHRSRQLVRSFEHDGSWTPLSQLTRSQREQLDANLEQSVEYLSEVAAITEPRRTDQ